MVDYHDANTTEEHLGVVNHPGAYNKGSDTDNQFWWVIVPITSDEKDYCFGAMPSSKTTNKGMYYTTMYTAFPYRCLDGVKAYIVDSVNVTGAFAHIKEIKTGEVPARTPVILECSNLLPKDNRLLPLMNDPAPIEGANLLKGEIWLKNENKTEDQYRTKFDSTKMLVLSTEKYAFVNKNNQVILAGTGKPGKPGTPAYVINNTCYIEMPTTLQPNTEFNIVKDDAPIIPIPLKEVMATADVVEGDSVKIIDNDLTCVYATQNSLYAKDNNGYSPKEALATDQSDYMGNVGFGAASTYDQSNWVQIDLAAPAASIDDSQAQYVGKKLTAVSGILDSKTPNAVIRATANPVAGSVDADYPISGVDDREDRINTYVTSSFIGSQISASGKNTFFMSPKAMEIADVTWAMWDEALQAFVVPVGTGANRGGFSGGFKVDMSMNEQPIAVSDLQDGKVYRFRALITAMATASGARKRAADSNAEVSTKYLVYPLTLTNSGTSIITSVVDVEATREVAGVKYYNMQGMESAQPFTGVNVVVTTYTDGSRATTKVVK